MKLADARRLAKGDMIRFGEAKFTRDCVNVQDGEVVAVTDRGGIKVVPFTDDGERLPARWVPYHHVVRKL